MMQLKQYIKKSLLITIIINFGLSVQLHAADQSGHARKRVERIVGHMQPDAGVKEVAGDASVQNAQRRLQKLKQQMQPTKSQSAISPEDVGATSTFIERPEHCQAVVQKWKTQLRLFGETIIQRMLENEERYRDTHFVFYHAQNQGNRIIVELLRNVYAWEYKKQLRLDFEFLRLWKDGSDFKDVNSYLDSFGIPNPFTVGDNDLNDNREDIRVVLLAVNPLLFGNFQDSGECTFDYFLNEQGISNFIHIPLKKIFKHYGFKESFIRDLIDINKRNKPKTGDIVQIFIPKNLVDDSAYLCQAWGAPQKEQLRDKYGQPIITDNKGVMLYDNVRQRYTKCSGILELLQINPDAVPESKTIQLRLFFSKMGPLLNPALGAKMFRFTTLSAEQLRESKEAVKIVASKIFAERAGSRYYAKAVYGAEPTAQQKPLTSQERSVVESAIERLTEMSIFEAVRQPDAIKRIKKLLARGADLNAKNQQGITPLMEAAMIGRLDVAQFLVSAGADIDIKDKYGKTALEIAESIKSKEIATYLQEVQKKRDAEAVGPIISKL
ncbi:MAG TPA: ankyrin repeat domain-containing protein [Candidatus Babeliales bacterium]|nr:ankyrin repeat domain-containing protein [Candidatus Babeliales bacterium]